MAAGVEKAFVCVAGAVSGSCLKAFGSDWDTGAVSSATVVSSWGEEYAGGAVSGVASN
jgi:hypothetical protein